MAKAPTARRFTARVFASPAIKSWKAPDEKPLRQALMAALDEVRAGGPLVLDLLVDFEAEDIEPRLTASNVLLWRSHRSRELGARVRRTLGFYSGESNVAAAVQVASAAEVNALLVGTTLWDSEFSIYAPPTASLTTLPDPHYEITAFASTAPWTVNQDTGSDTWLVTARDDAELGRVCVALERAFVAAGLDCHFEDPPPAVFGEG